MGKRKQPVTVLVNGKQYTEQSIKLLLQTNKKAQYRALEVLYSLQTDHEKYCGRTSDHNGVGFNKLDSQILTGFARQYKAYGVLSAKQEAILARRIVKYYKQIFKHMQGVI